MNDMTSGNIMKQLLYFMFPIFLGNLFQNLYSIVDTMIVGQYLGVNALAAVGTVGPIMFLITASVQGLTSGFGLSIAQAYGSKEDKKLKNYVAISYFLCACIVIVFMGSLLLGNMTLLNIINTPEEIIEQTHSYITVIYIGLPAIILYNMEAAIARALGDSKTPLYFLILSSIINVCLDLYLIGVCSLGVAGAAYATIISQGISGALCFVYVYKKYNIIHFKKDDAKIRPNTCVKLLGLGVPMALQYSIISLGGLIIQSALNQLGATSIAAMSTYYKLEVIVNQSYMSLGPVVANFVGQNFGARQMDRVKKGVRYAAIMAEMICVVVMLISYFISPKCIVLFVENPSTELIEKVTLTFHTLLWLYPVHALVIVYCNALQGLGKGIVTMISGVGELIARTLAALLLFPTLQYLGVCLAEPLAWCFALMVVCPCWIYYRRKILNVNILCR